MTALQTRRYQIKGSYQPLDADLTALAASGLAAAWTSYSPTITSGTGTITTLGTVSGLYVVMGKITLIKISIGITTNGTAATYVNATLPNTPASLSDLAGREGGISGKMLVGSVQSGSANVRIFNYDNTYPGASGAIVRVSGVYENS